MDSMTDVVLTDDEVAQALILAKLRKRQEIQDAAIREREAINRAALTTMIWSHLQTKDFMLFRAVKLFEGKFGVDEINEKVFEMLCHYFSEDPDFITLAQARGVKTPSMNKGILLFGGFGTGKTWLMRLFQQNRRQVYHMMPASYLAGLFGTDGSEAYASYQEKHKNPVNDANSFFQPYSGLCIDDLGTEEVAVHYGNRKNVIAELLETRYSKGNTGVFLHATTNLTYAQMQEFYGGRVISRLHEMFNFIELTGKDRRK